MLKSSLLFWFYLGIIIKRVSQARLGDHLCLDIRYSLMPSRRFFTQAISFLLIAIKAPSTTAVVHTANLLKERFTSLP